VILFGQMLVNIPPPWFAYVIYKPIVNDVTSIHVNTYDS
jgi:hypothetical protein